MRIFAIPIGFVIGLLAPLAAYFGIGRELSPAGGNASQVVMWWLNALFWPVVIGAPILGGFISGLVARTWHKSHGAIVGLLGVALVAWELRWEMGGGIGAALAACVFIPCGVLGGWLSRRIGAVDSAT